MSMQDVTVSTKPFEGQKPGTSGLRKKITEFTKTNYMENFIQCTLDAVGSKLAGSTLVVGGDGRFGVLDAVDKIIKMAAANGVNRLIVGKDGIMSTPAVSCVIRKHRTDGGIILTASHNPGGKDGDFGIKFNMPNGGPAPTDFTDKIFALSLKLDRYHICPELQCDVSKLGRQSFTVGNDDREFVVDVVDPIDDYLTLMKEIFDFPSIKNYLSNSKILLNSLHGVTGPYVERIFGEELSAPKKSFMKTNILPDFGGGHPDPNLTYASDLVQKMADKDEGFDFGVAFDGDGDRNMILGAEAFFVTPCDSLAVIADNLECIPYFQKHPVSGYARSMPTSAAVDRVAMRREKDCYETPTGWKFFGNLLDDRRIALCGEESFGTGSNHVREKDGIWAALAWLQILAAKKAPSVKSVLEDHWKIYGRNFFTRYDYENCSSKPCQEMMDGLQSFIGDTSNIGREFPASNGKVFVISKMDNFQYTDPVDKSVTTNQGIRIFFKDGSRIVMRLSGTGSSGATVRLYVDCYESKPENFGKSSQEMLKPCVEVALQISKLPEYTGRDKPTVIT